MTDYPFVKNKTALKPLERQDYKQLFAWHTDQRNLHLWQVSKEIMNYEDFVADFDRRMRRSIDFCMIIYNIDTHERVGMVYNYNSNRTDKTTFLCVYISPDYAHQAHGLRAAELFLQYLFYNHAFRKIYIEVFGYNKKVVRLAQMYGFEQEGHYKEHRWYGDRFWDLHVLALYLPNFKKRFPPPVL